MVNVLLVQEDPEFAYVIERYAASRGCEFNKIRIGQFDALAALQERPDVILLDIGVSLESSRRFFIECKTNAKTRQTPVYVCSASEAIVQEWEDLVEGCLLKPVMYEDFVEILAEIDASLSAKRA